MHPFTGAYSDEELAAIASYTQRLFGGMPSSVTPEQIASIIAPIALLVIAA